MTVTWASDLTLDTTPVAFAVAMDADEADAQAMLRTDHPVHEHGAELMRKKNSVKYVMFQGDDIVPGDRFVLLKVKDGAPFTGTMTGSAAGTDSAHTLRTASSAPSSTLAGAAAGEGPAMTENGSTGLFAKHIGYNSGIGAECGVCENYPCSFHAVVDHIVGISHSGDKTPRACRRAVWNEFKCNTPSPARGKNKDINGHVKIPRCVVNKTNVLFRDTM